MIFTKRALTLLSLSVVCANAFGAGEIFSNQSSDRRVPQLNAMTTAKRGTVAPTGGFWSEVQNDAGNTTESNTNAGSNVAYFAANPHFRLADDFTVGDCYFVVDKVSVFSYQTGATAAPFLGGNVNFWTASPTEGGTPLHMFGGNGVALPSVVTDVIQATPTTTGNIYRIFNSSFPAPGTAPGTTRKVWQVTMTLPNEVEFQTGSYWIDWQLITVTGAGSAFTPSTTHEGMRGVAGANGRQRVYDAVNLVHFWQDLIDAGNPATAPDVPQDTPFILHGKWKCYPTGATTNGELFTGNLASLKASDDNYMRFFNNSDDLTCVNDFTAESPTTTATEIVVMTEMSVTRPGLEYIISVFNYSTNSFEPIAGDLASTSDTTFSGTLNTNASNYVSGGDVTVQVAFGPTNDEDPSQDGWLHNFDVVCWTIED